VGPRIISDPSLLDRITDPVAAPQVVFTIEAAETIGTWFTVNIIEETAFEQVPEPNPAAVNVIETGPVVVGVNVGFRAEELSNVPPVLDHVTVE